MYIRVFNDIGDVVKVPFSMKTVAINSQEQDQEGNKEKGIFPQIGKMPGDMQFELVFQIYRESTIKR